MIELQVINYLLETKNYDFVVNNAITSEYFVKNYDKFEFIKNHYNQFNDVPDKATFINAFPDFVFTEVFEGEKYLADKLNEEYTYNKMVGVLNKAAELVQNDSRDAVEYLLNSVNTLSKDMGVKIYDYKEEINNRFTTYLEKCKNKDKFYITTGFPELDEVIGGWDRKEEYASITARTGIGKTFIMLYFALHCAKLGLNVGVYSGEMNSDKVGYRLDTLFTHISQFAITRGDESIENEYKSFINKILDIKGNIKILSASSLGGFANVSNLKSFVKKEKLDILFIDQISLMEDMNNNRIRHEKFESISKDIKALQTQLQIPIILLAQLNRGVEKDNDPDTTNVGGSDRISQDSTLMLSLTRKDGKFTIQIMKNRDGASGVKLNYLWDVDKGLFTYIPTEDAPKALNPKENCDKVRRKFDNKDNQNATEPF